jgi:putative flippase GtrA
MPPLKQISRFGVVGLVATAVHVGVGLGLHGGGGIPAFWANIVAFCTALGVSYFGQTRITFPEATAGRAAFARFASIAVSGLALNQIIVWLVTSAFGGPYWLALAIIIATVPAATFLALKFWALRH